MSFQRLTTRRRRAVPKNQNFSRIKNTEFDKEGKVEEFLDTQFTVSYDNGSFGFLFYADKGDTWHPLDEGKKKRRPKPSDFSAIVGGLGVFEPVWHNVFGAAPPVPTQAVQEAMEAIIAAEVAEGAIPEDMPEEMDIDQDMLDGMELLDGEF